MSTLTQPTRVRRTRVGPTLGRTLLDIVLVLWIAATLAFATLHFIPGDPVNNLLRGNFHITDELRAAVTESYGLDKPVWQQYVIYIGGLLQGSLGTSFQKGAPVAQVLASEAGATIQLAVAALFIALVVATVVAVLTAGRPRWRWLAQGFELTFVAVPNFWIGILLLIAFSFTLRIFPSSGADGPASLILPAVTLALGIAGQLSQLIREGIERALDEPHVLTARSRGLGELSLRVKHTFRHALLPAITVSGSLFGGMLVGTTIVETLFGRPGLGRIMLGAVTAKDIPLVMGIVVVSAVVFVIVRIVVDALYLVVDPRLREAS